MDMTWYLQSSLYDTLLTKINSTKYNNMILQTKEGSLFGIEDGCVCVCVVVDWVAINT